MEKGRIPNYAAKIIYKLRSAGYDAFAVGGCVRDTLMGRRPNDWDIACSASWEETAALFRKTVLTGAEYGTVTVFTYGGRCEVTTFRRDGDYPDRRRPESVEFVNDVRADLGRRDFTVNAMAMTPEGDVIDLFGGRADIADRLIRCVGEPDARFGEDALRMFRAARFSAQLGFAVEEKTLASVKKNAALSASLSAERVREETEKILLSPRPEILGGAVEWGLYGSFLPAGKRVETGVIGTVPKKQLLRWCAFCALAVPPEKSEEFLKKFRLDKKTVRIASEGCRLAEDFPTDREGIKLLLSEREADAVECAAAAAQAMGRRDAVKMTREVIRGGSYVTVGDLAVTGMDLMALGIKGREIGKALRYLAGAATAGKVENEKKALLDEIKGRL